MDLRLQSIADYYDGKTIGDKVLHGCPTGAHAHDDIAPGCWTEIGDNDNIIIFCHKCDSGEQAFEQMRIDLPELFPKKTKSIIKKDDIKQYLDHVPSNMPPLPGIPANGVNGIQYIYTDSNGKDLGLHVYRWMDDEGKKQIRPVSAVESNMGEFGWSWS